VKNCTGLVPYVYDEYEEDELFCDLCGDEIEDIVIGNDDICKKCKETENDK
jgi:hypothetical protein